MTFFLMMSCLFSGKGWIDPCPFWDDDGKAYMVSAFAKSRIGFKSILNLCEITPDCLHMVDEGKHIFDGNVENQETIEGPKMYKRNGYYYFKLDNVFHDTCVNIVQNYDF